MSKCERRKCTYWVTDHCNDMEEFITPDGDFYSNGCCFLDKESQYDLIHGRGRAIE